MRFRLAGRVAAMGSLLSVSAAMAASGVGPNLIVNGNAEASAGAPDFSSVAAPVGWTTTGSMTAVQYAIGGTGDLNTAQSTAVGGGLNYFAGGTSSLSTAAQTLNVAGFTPQSGSGPIWFRLTGHLGGFSIQDDNATLAASFNAVTAATIGPVLAGERSNDSKLLWRAGFGIIPAGSTTGSIVLTATRTSGSYNDGYADNLAMQLCAEPGDATVDSHVNFDDLLRLAQNYTKPGTWESGDFDGNGVVGFDDLLLLAQHYGSNGSVLAPGGAGSAFASDWARALALAPEPASLGALSILLACTRRRRG